MKSDLRIEFIPPPEPGLWAWVVCSALALACAGSVGVAVWQAKQIEQIRENVETLKFERNRKLTSLPARSPAKAMSYDADARTMLRELAFSTNEALTALENVAVLGVTPTALDLQANTGWVRVQVEFADQESLLKYLSELNAGEEWPRWKVVQARAGGRASIGTATLQSVW